MFGSKKEPSQASETPVYLYTVDNLPGESYRALGLVRATATKLGSNSFTDLIESLKDQTRRIGGDAIIGFRVEGFSAGMGNSFTMLFAYGTAIVHTDTENQ